MSHQSLGKLLTNKLQFEATLIGILKICCNCSALNHKERKEGAKITKKVSSQKKGVTQETKKQP
jgi:hypothetical protein